MGQLDQNLQSLAVSLSNNDIASLDALSKPALNFPMELINNRAANLAQAGTSVNGVSSLKLPLAPQSIKEVY